MNCMCAEIVGTTIWTSAYVQDSNLEEPKHAILAYGHMDSEHMKKAPDEGGCALFFPQSGFLNYMLKILIDF
jgi:hypothetical protein